MFNKVLSTISVAAFSAMVLIGGSVAANAATLLMVDGNINNSGNPYTLVSGGDKYSTGSTAVAIGSMEMFTHNYTFDLIPPIGQSTGSVVWQVDNSNDIPMGSNFGIMNMTASWNGGTNEGVDFFVITDGMGNSLYPSNLSPAVNDWYMNSLPGGQNVLTFTGTGLSGGGNYASFVSAVPLPPAAILFGTALFGIGALRRRKDKKAMDLAA